ncbi:hypothetical protein L6Q96_01820 [Candidatus Binatia bacterium]|nr:hypothetical protein [Candidatus Binatia bacterium]
MVSYLALYRGSSLATAELISVSTDPALISAVASTLLKQATPPPDDAAAAALRNGRRRALRLIHKQAGA